MRAARPTTSSAIPAGNRKRGAFRRGGAASEAFDAPAVAFALVADMVQGFPNLYQVENIFRLE
jgi:hypothetical protein